jgi:hypothetical protein
MISFFKTKFKKKLKKFQNETNQFETYQLYYLGSRKLCLPIPAKKKKKIKKKNQKKKFEVK